MEDEFVEHLQKRIRNLQKRQARLEAYQRTADSDPAKLNADQLAALSQKDSVDAPLKELLELQTLYSAQEAARAAADRTAQNAEIAAAEARGRAHGRDVLAVLTRFLHTAAVKNQVPGATPDELAAVNQLLHTLYIGDETSLDAVDKLVARSNEEIAAGLSFAAVRALSEPSEAAAPAEPEPSTGAAESSKSVQISFLQVDELEAAQASEAAAPSVPAAADKRKKNGKKPKRDSAASTPEPQAAASPTAAALDAAAATAAPAAAPATAPAASAPAPETPAPASPEDASFTEATADADEWTKKEAKRAPRKKSTRPPYTNKPRAQ